METLRGDELVHRARDVAARVHAGQQDKAGRPYVEHPERVADLVHAHGPEYVAAAWLHDVIEDSDVTLDELKANGFPAAVVEAVDALTRREGESHEDAVLRACQDVVAIVVKAADVHDNSDPARLALLPDDVRSRLRDKYDHAQDILDEHGAPGFAAPADSGSERGWLIQTIRLAWWALTDRRMDDAEGEMRLSRSAAWQLVRALTMLRSPLRKYDKRMPCGCRYSAVLRRRIAICVDHIEVQPRD